MSLFAAGGCGLFYHKEVVDVPDPAMLTHPQVMEQARGAKLTYTEKTTGEKVSGTLMASRGDTGLLIAEKKESHLVPVSNMEAAKLEMQASKLSFGGCVTTGCLSAMAGIGSGVYIGSQVYENSDNDEPKGCAEALVWPIVMAVLLMLAIIVGFIVAVIVAALVLLVGTLVLPNILLNENVKSIKLKADKLRKMLSRG